MELNTESIFFIERALCDFVIEADGEAKITSETAFDTSKKSDD